MATDLHRLKNDPYEGFATVPNAFAPHEADLIRAMIETQPKIEAGVSGDNVTDKRVRDSRVKWLYPTSVEHKWIFDRVASIVNTVNDQFFAMDLWGCEGIQLTEYDSAYQGFYGSHTDSAYGPSGEMRNRKLSVTMQLSDPLEYEGGDLLLYHQNLTPFKAARDKGTMTLFRSTIVHEVSPVTKGTRYSFVTWVRGPLFR